MWGILESRWVQCLEEMKRKHEDIHLFLERTTARLGDNTFVQSVNMLGSSIHWDRRCAAEAKQDGGVGFRG